MIHPNLASKQKLIDLEIASVYLEDEKNYPWIMLVPLRENVSKWIDLSFEDQVLLLRDLDLAQRVMWDLFKPKQLNVAAIGNKTPQLHVHVIVRKEEDPAWPGTVWDHPVKSKYLSSEKEEVASQITQAFLKQLAIRQKEQPSS